MKIDDIISSTEPIKVKGTVVCNYKLHELVITDQYIYLEHDGEIIIEKIKNTKGLAFRCDSNTKRWTIILVGLTYAALDFGQNRTYAESTFKIIKQQWQAIN